MNQRRIIQCWFGISDVSDNADLESALYDTVLIRNSRCIRQHWYQYQRYVFTYSFILWSNERCRIQRWFGISAVSDNADSKLALYPTALIRNQRYFRQRWFTKFYLRIRIPPRIRNRIRKYFRMWIRGPYWVISWKKLEVKNLVLLSL